MVAMLAVGLWGCAGDPPFSQGPPEGWEGARGKWWVAGQDTTGFYPVMETLADMSVTDAAPDETQLRRNDRSQFERAVKRSLIRLYRNEPAIVDSLFESEIKPLLADVAFTNDPVQDVENFKRRAYKLLARHFREPRARLQIGEDVQVVYPDSLRARGVEGAVVLQVRLNTDGEPLSVELVEGVHPVLDQIAMDATTKMRWVPAYAMVKNDWVPIPAWARFRISFSRPEGQG